MNTMEYLDKIQQFYTYLYRFPWRNATRPVDAIKRRFRKMFNREMSGYILTTYNSKLPMCCDVEKVLVRIANIYDAIVFVVNPSNMTYGKICVFVGGKLLFAKVLKADVVETVYKSMQETANKSKQK